MLVGQGAGFTEVTASYSYHLGTVGQLPEGGNVIGIGNVASANNGDSTECHRAKKLKKF